MVLNAHPAYWGTGGRLTYVADDYHEIRLKLPLTWRTRNVVGTLFGGSMFGAVDPVYMLMLMRILGSEYIVWDTEATIRFRKPGRETLYARFQVDEEDIDRLRVELETAASTERTYTVDLVNRDGVVHASIEKSIYIRRKDAPRSDPRGVKQEARSGAAPARPRSVSTPARDGPDRTT